MKDVGSGMGFKNISDLVLKEIHGILKTKNPTKEQISEYKMTEREIYKKFCNLSEEKLNTKSNKNVYMKNIVMTAIIKRCRSKKKGIRAINGFRKKIMIPNSEISGCPEFEVKSKIGKWFMNKKILEEYSVRVYEIDPFFYEHYKEKIKFDKNGCKYILFRIDVYFTESFFGHEQNHEGRELIFEKTRQEVLEKNLVANLLEFIQVMQEKVMIQNMKLVIYKYLSVNLKMKK